MADFEVLGTVKIDDSGTVSVNNMNAGLGAMIGISSGVVTAFTNMGLSAVTALGGMVVNAVSAAADALKNFVGDVITVGEKHETTLSQLINQMHNYTEATKGAGVSIYTLNGIADALSKVTTYTNDQILSGDAVLLQFSKIGRDVLPAATKATADYAAKMGLDIPTAAAIVGKAIGDPVTGIGRLNTQLKLFEPNQLKTIENMAKWGHTAEAQKLILDRLNQVVGGSAAAAAGTLEGKTQMLNNQFEEMKVKIGEKLIPVLSGLMDKIGPLVAKYLPGLTDFLANQVVPAVGKIIDKFGQFLGWLTTNAPTIASMAHAAFDTIGTIISGVITSLDGVQTSFDTFQTNLSNLGKSIGDAIASVPGKVTEMVTNVSTALSDGVKSWIKDTVKKVNDFTQAGQAIIDGIIQGIKDAESGLMIQIGITAANALQKMKDALGIHSPSKLFMEVGFQIPAGLAEGIKAAAHLPSMALTSMVPGMTSAGASYASNHSIQNTANNVYNFGNQPYAPQGGGAADLLQQFRKS